MFPQLGGFRIDEPSLDGVLPLAGTSAQGAALDGPRGLVLRRLFSQQTCVRSRRRSASTTHHDEAD
jgi:hypothetical protein